ncbi:GLPGLI family protein [Elizabethkingia meningoseptica]|uniref:GLPGLI family protein n=1 Tax=Elizabethkingia meningoseptica TaxID=238 RepID=UPI003892455A
MKKNYTLFAFLLCVTIFSQEKAIRFYYELTYKPNKENDNTEMTITILDISNKKSLYRDYTIVAQDSIVKSKVETIQKLGKFKEIEKIITIPKFSYKVIKYHPDYEIQYIDGIEQQLFSYNEKINLSWVIHPDKRKIGIYNTQKASVVFGGRKWDAWFSTEIPFNDGPYKFYGLPGLIVQIGDDKNNYSWVLKGNKNIENYSDISYTENLYYSGKTTPINIQKEKFTKSFNDYKNDPLAKYKSQVPDNILNKKLPNSDLTYRDRLREQEETLKKFLNSNNNPIELPVEKPD